MTFDPKKYLTEIKGKQYLEAKYRLVWFREECPNDSIHTEIVSITDNGLVIMKASIARDGMVLATAHAVAPLAGAGAYVGRGLEKAETSAIARALAMLGYGTQFAQELDDDDIADAPVERKPAPQKNAPKQEPKPAKQTSAQDEQTALSQPCSFLANSQDHTGIIQRELLTRAVTQYKIDTKAWLAGANLKGFSEFNGTLLELINLFASPF